MEYANRPTLAGTTSSSRNSETLYSAAVKAFHLSVILTCVVLAGAGEHDEEMTSAVKTQLAAVQFGLTAIGHIEKDAERSFIRLKAGYRDGLLGLEDWSHLWVLYWFDRNDTPEQRSVLQVHPRGDHENPLTGVFATRSPLRPNLVALNLCRVLSIEGCDIEIESTDAFNNTPVIDIKPYIAAIDTPKGTLKQPGWVDASNSDKTTRP
jgi:tRNA (adenine37-N6)-methyltransferase